MAKTYINRETKASIAMEPEDLPPLREGYVRVVHQTRAATPQSFIDNGLVYNWEYAGREHESFSRYADITSMAVSYDEDGFWRKLTEEGIRHHDADKLAVFDMPKEEFLAHTLVNVAQHLNGTISAGYLVGYIPNYGTKSDTITQKLSQEEMLEKKSISQTNPLPPEYETPRWQEDIQKALDKNIEANKHIDPADFFAIQLPDYSALFSFARHENEAEPQEDTHNFDENTLPSDSSLDNQNYNADDWGDWGEEIQSVTTNRQEKPSTQQKIYELRGKLHPETTNEVVQEKKQLPQTNIVNRNNDKGR